MHTETAGALSATLGLVLVLIAAGPSNAAMRYCKGTVVGEGVAESELEAKQQAMADWKAKSVVAGIDYPAWRIALSKSFDCESADDGGYICNATAEPCTISQVPLE
jgi:hypothetical protein